MKAYIFPGQGAQFSGMGLPLYETSPLAKSLFEEANAILGFNITDIMFSGSSEDLRQTRVTQPAIFLHSTILAKVLGERFSPQMVAGHSLGEFSALVAANSLSFEDGLQLVSQRAQAMQAACEVTAGTMAAVLGLEDNIVEDSCNEISGIVVAANYNCPGQLVISGAVDAINLACETLKEKGARRALVLPVGGAFHSPLKEPDKDQIAAAIEHTNIQSPVCPIYQNVTAQAVQNEVEIKANLIAQLTAPVKWTQSVQQMILDGVSEFIEVGPGKVLQGLVKKIDRQAQTSTAEI